MESMFLSTMGKHGLDKRLFITKFNSGLTFFQKVAFIKSLELL